MSKTYASLFRRPSLDAILTSFIKAGERLDDFVNQAKADLSALNTEADKIATERTEIEADIARANRTKAKIADLVA